MYRAYLYEIALGPIRVSFIRLTILCRRINIVLRFYFIDVSIDEIPVHIQTTPYYATSIWRSRISYRQTNHLVVFNPPI